MTSRSLLLRQALLQVIELSAQSRRILACAALIAGWASALVALATVIQLELPVALGFLLLSVVCFGVYFVLVED